MGSWQYPDGLGAHAGGCAFKTTQSTCRVRRPDSTFNQGWQWFQGGDGLLAFEKAAEGDEDVASPFRWVTR